MGDEKDWYDAVIKSSYGSKKVEHRVVGNTISYGKIMRLRKKFLEMDHACKRYPLIDEVAFVGFKTGIGPCLAVVS